MSRPAVSIELTDQIRAALERMIRGTTTEQRLVTRARIVLAAAEGRPTNSIASQLNVQPTMVSKWRGRFAEHGLAGLKDKARPGARRKYTQETTRRILAKIDGKPPAGNATWTGSLLAEALGDIPEHHVWQVLRQHAISLQRRRSWCISTDPQFAPKAADIVGLYLDPPGNAVVIAMDEKPAIQALERTQGYLKLPNGRALTGFSHEYKRHGTTTLFAALNVATGQVRAGHYQRRRRAEFLDFMNQIVAEHPDCEIHVILDNLSTHKPKNDRWLARHKDVHFHYTPTHASWLNQVECWFSILTRRALRGASFASAREVRTAIDAFIAAYNKTAAPFEWTKRTVRSVAPANYYADLSK